MESTKVDRDLQSHVIAQVDPHLPAGDTNTNDDPAVAVPTMGTCQSLPPVQSVSGANGNVDGAVDPGDASVIHHNDEKNEGELVNSHEPEPGVYMGVKCRWRGGPDVASPGHVKVVLRCDTPTHEQLTTECRSIYAGFRMIEKKALEVTQHVQCAVEPGIDNSNSQSLGVASSSEGSCGERSLNKGSPTSVRANESPLDLTDDSVGDSHGEEPAQVADSIKEEEAEEVNVLEDPRNLEDQRTYKKIGGQHCVKAGEIWIKSLMPLQYRALGDLFTALLSEHLDLTLVSLHPCSPSNLRHFPADKNVDERVWRRCIFSYLDVLRSRLVESYEHLDSFLRYSYGILASLQEMPGADRGVWLELQADLARYRMGISKATEERRYWKRIAETQYSRALDSDTTANVIHQKLTTVKNSSKYTMYFFHHVKSVAMKTATSEVLTSLLSAMHQFLAESNDDASTKPPSFFMAVARLILAHLEPSESSHLDRFTALFADISINQYKSMQHHDNCKASSANNPENTRNANEVENFVQDEGTMPKISSDASNPTQNINERSKQESEGLVDEKSPENTLHPSAELALLLFQLLIGFPANEKITTASVAEYTDAGDETRIVRPVTEHAARLLSLVTSKILSKSDTTNLKFWEFLHALLVCMKTLRRRPAWIKRFGYAFHSELMTPVLNMLLHQAQNKEGASWSSAYSQDFPTLFSTINNNYCTTDSTEQNGLDKARDTPSTEDSLAIVIRRRFTCPLPEDYQLQGFPFVGCGLLGCQQQTCPVENEAETDTDTVEPSASTVITQLESKEMPSSVITDTPASLHCNYGHFFPSDWFENAKYDLEERHVRLNYVQDLGTVRYRERRILWLVIQLVKEGPLLDQQAVADRDGNDFFSSYEDESGHFYVKVNQEAATTESRLDAELPQVVQRDRGVEVVYVHDTLHRRVARVDAAWQRQSESVDEDNTLEAHLTRSEMDRTCVKNNPGLAATCTEVLYQGITSAWDLQMSHHSKCEGFITGHCQDRVKDEPAEEAAVSPCSGDITEQYSPRDETGTANGQQPEGSTRAVEGDELRYEESEGWTIIDAPSIDDTNFNGGNMVGFLAF